MWIYICVCLRTCVWVRLPMGSLFVAGFMMSLKARGLGRRLRHIVRCTPGVRSASQPCQVYVQTSTMRVFEERAQIRHGGCAVAYAWRAARISCVCYLPHEAISGVVWRIPVQVPSLRSR